MTKEVRFYDLLSGHSDKAVQQRVSNIQKNLLKTKSLT